MSQTIGKHPKRGDVYWVCFDPSKGTEIQKTRPAVVISNDMMNKNLSRVIVAPITSNVKHIFDFDCQVTIRGKPGKIMVDQLRSVDKSRLSSKIMSLDAKTFERLEAALKITFDLS
jgi:mRNA interferase MazF